MTERCNLNCIYCHREGVGSQTGEELTPEEFERIVRVAARLGVRKVKVTGGEPLLRSDITDIVGRIARVPGILEVSLTTNGVNLADHARRLKETGLSRVNINLVSLNPETYQKITGLPVLDKVLSGVREAEEAGLTPIKLNVVVLRGLNDGEIGGFIDFIEGRDIILQLIELERVGCGDSIYSQYYRDLGAIEAELRSRAERVDIKPLHNRRVYHLNGGRVKVEMVRPFHNSEFCMNCRRLRVTADGKLKPCLMRTDNHVDILPILRRGGNFDEEALEDAFRRVVEAREPYYPTYLLKTRKTG